jgi:hypothetical protein
MGAILTIFFRILPNFELKLEIPNIMLVCKFEINCPTNKNLKSAYNISRTDGLTDGCPAFPYPPLRFAGAGDNYMSPSGSWNTAFFFLKLSH